MLYTMVYMPVLSKGSHIMSTPLKFKVLHSHQRSDNLLADYCDGELFKSHELFGCHESAIQIIMYFDEVEICNPLGGHNGIHKLGKCM